MATPDHDPGTDPRAQGGPVSLGSIWQQWARLRDAGMVGRAAAQGRDAADRAGQLVLAGTGL